MLPKENNLNISAFSRIFDKTTNAYKYLFTLAILQKINQCDESNEIQLIDLAVEMLVLSWFPLRFFKLSFGRQDQCEIVLNQFLASKFNIYDDGAITNKTVFKLRENLKQWLIDRPDVLSKMMFYVPYRLLTPFFDKQLKGLKDGEKNSQIKMLANESGLEEILLYQFSENSILINSKWSQYLKMNMPLIEGWVKWNWCEFLQARNPSVPSIPNKILPILKRISLTKETKFWKKVLHEKNFKCIYTDEALNSFELDHFLPWSFVTHNQLWNLIPAIKFANTSKSNNLPDLSYLEGFIENQSDAIHISKNIFSETKWKKYMEPYLCDLNIGSYDELLDESKLEESYKKTIMPLYEIAKSNGFSAGWLFKYK